MIVILTWGNPVIMAYFEPIKGPLRAIPEGSHPWRSRSVMMVCGSRYSVRTLPDERRWHRGFILDYKERISERFTSESLWTGRLIKLLLSEGVPFEHVMFGVPDWRDHWPTAAWVHRESIFVGWFPGMVSLSNQWFNPPRLYHRF